MTRVQVVMRQNKIAVVDALALEERVEFLRRALKSAHAALTSATNEEDRHLLSTMAEDWSRQLRRAEAAIADKKRQRRPISGFEKQLDELFEQRRLKET